MTTKVNPTYQLRFFFDYNCGGCLWCGNDASYEKFDDGCLDSKVWIGKILPGHHVGIKVNGIVFMYKQGNCTGKFQTFWGMTLNYSTKWKNTKNHNTVYSK